MISGGGERKNTGPDMACANKNASHRFGEVHFFNAFLLIFKRLGR